MMNLQNFAQRPPPPYGLKAGDLFDLFTLVKAPKKRERDDLETDEDFETESDEKENWVAFMALRRQLSRLIRESLKAKDGNAWRRYWETKNRLETFADLFDGLHALAPGLELETQRETQIECRSRIVSSFPQLDEEICFIEHTLNRCARIVHELVKDPPPEGESAADSDCASRFNWNSIWTLVCLNTLLFITDGIDASKKMSSSQKGVLPIVITEALIGGIITTARTCVLEAHHAVRDGQRLRESPELESVHGLLSGDDDESIDDFDLVDVAKDIKLEEQGSIAKVEQLS